MSSKILAAVAALALSTAAAGAATLNEADFGEFGDSYDAPTIFSGYSTITQGWQPARLHAHQRGRRFEHADPAFPDRVHHGPLGLEG